ncbi:hypothetical protein HNY73_006023 [Argiope bruennichi]|uniref:Uncharacterized protein n=1 Tax=Argiope bruennichi TaxID=94029 RepID=A0A8T0FJI2_ARGBR|nr:hypothetical protein HNY73_006023 [Argiope bruennichi]
MPRCFLLKKCVRSYKESDGAATGEWRVKHNDVAENKGLQISDKETVGKQPETAAAGAWSVKHKDLVVDRGLQISDKEPIAGELDRAES